MKPTLLGIFVCAGLWLVAGCGHSDSIPTASNEITLRVGVGQLPSGNSGAGLAALLQNQSTEGLARIAEDGKVEPRLAEGWTISKDGLILAIRLRSGVTFHDGSPVTSKAVADVLQATLPAILGPAFSDVKQIRPAADSLVEITLKRPSPFVQEALEVQIRKGNVGTGPFQRAASDNELRSNPRYYLDPPIIDRIVVTNYPSVRAAWADLLRDQIDMLYEVGADALSSLTGARTVSVYSFTRPYQYVIAFNQRSKTLSSPSVRRALNAAIDREAFIRDGLDGRGEPSSGPIPPRHWAFASDLPQFKFAPVDSVGELSKNVGGPKSADGIVVRFKCLIVGEHERLALLVKRQLEMVGVAMDIEIVSPDTLLETLRKSSYEAVMLDMVSGPSVLRTYSWWHTLGAFNPGTLGSQSIDVALDRIRYSKSDDEYRAAVAGFQRAIVQDPPGLFLAWSERSRAVSRRFDVAAEPGRDILTTLRSWRPANDFQSVGRN